MVWTWAEQSNEANTAATNNKTLFINLFLLAECVDENAAEYGGADGAEEHGYLSKRLEMAGDIGSQVGE